MTSYYDRDVTMGLDGTPVYRNPADAASELEVAKTLAAGWRCTIVAYPEIHHIDYYAHRNERVFAYIELKTRSHAADKYPTVFLNERKWYHLMDAVNFLHRRSIFVVRFTDGIRYQLLKRGQVWETSMGGTTYNVKSSTDYEPVIHVPVNKMVVFNPATALDDLRVAENCDR